MIVPVLKLSVFTILTYFADVDVIKTDSIAIKNIGFNNLFIFSPYLFPFINRFLSVP
jgi:hypothetical protein